ncbi:MAG: beta-ketoacyl-[acyl-carrier-protein] synthase family protein [Phycisphaerales bacterium]
MDRRRVVITGLGVASGLGIGVEALWDGLLEGRSAIKPIRQFDAAAFPLRFAGEVEEGFKIRDFVPKSYRKATKVMCRDIELAVAAAAKAVGDAGIRTAGSVENGDAPTYAPNRMGCQIGAGLIVAEMNELTAAFATARENESSPFDLKRWGETGMQNLTPLWLLKYLPNMLACHVTIVHDCQGPSNTITCAESSGALSVGESMRVIERGDADLCFTGGAESKINPLGLLRQWHTGMFADARELNGDANDGSRVVRPFGTDARGSAPGEGAAILLVEGADAATKRDARVYAEIAGFGASQSSDLAAHGLQPGASGAGLAAAIRQALRDAEVEADAIDAIVPFGAGAPEYDEFEANALRTIFGDRLARIPLVTTKPNVGLTAAASSAIDLAVGALCLHHQTLPARINGESPRDGLDAGTTKSRDARLSHVLCCGSGFGGQNAAVILKRWSPSSGG